MVSSPRLLHAMPETQDKFEAEDIPRVLAALKNFRDGKCTGKIEISFASGGIGTITATETRKYK